MIDSADLGPLDCDDWDEQLVRRLVALKPTDAQQFVGRIETASASSALDYIKDSGERIIIPVTFSPARFSAQQVARLHKAFEGLASAVAKVAAAWLDTPALQQVLPIQPYEAEWLRLARWAPGNPLAAVFHRWDFAMNVSADLAAENFKLFEVNSVDVGGIHYAAATNRVMADAMGKLQVDGWSDRCGHDPRQVLTVALQEYSKGMGNQPPRIAIAENQDFTTGITEAESICKFWREKNIDADCVDARQFGIDSSGASYRGKPIDVVYRNIELRDLADLETAGGDISGLRAAAKSGKLVSSPFGELDHKSLWEALGSGEFAELFTTEEKQLISRHVPWTRLLRERRTSDRTGNEIDLSSYVRQLRADLVMKPNRSCGGQGVTIGRNASPADWDRTLESALQLPNSWVVQEFIPIPRRRTCRVTSDGRFEPVAVFAVYGGYCSTAGPGFVGRASHSPIVNVMQGGGMLAVLGRDDGGI